MFSTLLFVKGSKMSVHLNEASRWRVDLARELCSRYSLHPGVAMTCLGGSSARGIADRFSDLDIIVYWDEMDEDWIKAEPLASACGIARTAIMSLAPGTFIESYYLDTLKIDFGHVILSDFQGWLEPLAAPDSPDPDLIGMAGGFLSSIAFSGEDVFSRIRETVPEYPEALALDVVKKNLSFYVKGYLDGQCFERGDLLAYHDGMVIMLKKILNTCAALNRHYYYAGEARWAEYHLQFMVKKPAELTWPNVKWILSHPGAEAVAKLGRIQNELLDLVAAEFPSLAEKVAYRKSRMESLEVKACISRPEF